MTDEDRSGWLNALADLIGEQVRQNQSAVIACSALKQSYRDRLQTDEVRFVYLRGSYDLIETRLQQRAGHYMPPSLLASQFATLEEPHDAPLTVDISLPPERGVTEIIRQLQSEYYNDVSPTCELRYSDRVGGGDGYASGFFYGLLTAKSRKTQSTSARHTARC